MQRNDLHHKQCEINYIDDILAMFKISLETFVFKLDSLICIYIKHRSKVTLLPGVLQISETIYYNNDALQ